jgi:hypothetical protein
MPCDGRELAARRGLLPAAARGYGISSLLDVLRIEEGSIAEIIKFEATLFPAFGLPIAL